MFQRISIKLFICSDILYPIIILLTTGMKTISTPILKVIPHKLPLIYLFFTLLYSSLSVFKIYLFCLHVILLVFFMYMCTCLNICAHMCVGIGPGKACIYVQDRSLLHQQCTGIGRHLCRQQAHMEFYLVTNHHFKGPFHLKIKKINYSSL